MDEINSKKNIRQDKQVELLKIATNFNRFYEKIPIQSLLDAQKNMGISALTNEKSIALIKKSTTSTSNTIKLLDAYKILGTNQFKENFGIQSYKANRQLLAKISMLPNAHYTFDKGKDNYLQYQHNSSHESSSKRLEAKGLASTLAITQVFNHIHEEDMLNFYYHLSENPMMGLAHNIGIEIYNQLKKYRNPIDVNLRLFRARRRVHKSDRPFTLPELFNPPYGISGQGRYNLHGINPLYLCNSIEGAIAEVMAEPSEIVDIPEFKLHTKINLLDATKNECALFNYCGFENKSDLSLKPEYLVPNFLSQCCKLSGVDGIKYFSDKYEDAINYVFFRFNINDFTHIRTHVKNI